MLDFKSRSGFTGRQRGCQEAGCSRAAGEAVEGGEEGTVDGQPEGAGLGQEWQMPLPLLNGGLEEKKLKNTIKL